MKEKKKELRKLIRYRKTRYSDSALDRLSVQILQKLESSARFQSAKIILLYFSMNDEVSTHAFIEKWYKDKLILLPVVVDDVLELRVYSGPKALKTGSYGIREPIGEMFTDYEKIDLAIVPGMAFDNKGNRLGRGKGYYDKLLTDIKVWKTGICFPFQILEEIPVEEFDIQMNAVIYG